MVTGVGCAPVSLLPLGPIPELLNPWESGTFGSLGWEGTGRGGEGAWLGLRVEW